MKANNHHPEITAVTIWVCRSNAIRLWLVLLFLLPVIYAQAQEIPVRRQFTPGENVQYELYFKWGLLMSRAGHASLSIREAEYEGSPAFHYRLLFRTSGIIEKVYKMRDTIDCHFTPDMLAAPKRKASERKQLLPDRRPPFLIQRRKNERPFTPLHADPHEDRHNTRGRRRYTYVRHARSDTLLAFLELGEDESRRLFPFRGSDRPRPRQSQFPLCRPANR